MPSSNFSGRLQALIQKGFGGDEGIGNILPQRNCSRDGRGKNAAGSVRGCGVDPRTGKPTGLFPIGPIVATFITLGVSAFDEYRSDAELQNLLGGILDTFHRTSGNNFNFWKVGRQDADLREDFADQDVERFGDKQVGTGGGFQYGIADDRYILGLKKGRKNGAGFRAAEHSGFYGGGR